MKPIVLGWARWIAATPLSNWLGAHQWVVPTSQSIHIMCVGIVFSCALMIDIRILGTRSTGRSVLQLTNTLVPWMYAALGVLLVTGSIQIIAEPVRQFVTPAFWWKMAMIVAVVALTIWFTAAVRRRGVAWDTPSHRPPAARMFAIGSLCLWVAIIFCGRFIGYTWNFYV